MNPYNVNLKPVYSCPAENVSHSLKLPEKWRLSWHQLETWKALQDPNVDVIVNTAMTGDGKSLSAYLDAMQGEQENEFIRYSMGLYPTNELARDQESQIKSYIEKFQPNNDPRVNRLSGALLELYAESEGRKKAQAILDKVYNSEILLTNPDILHYLHRNAYLSPKDAPDKLWRFLDTTFTILIHDEFHVLSAPQVGSIINTMLLMRVTDRDHKHLFLSATPENALIERLDKVGFNCKVINPYEQEKYRFPDTEAEKQQLQSEGWRQVAREIHLTFVPLTSGYGASETWLWENRELIRNYFSQYPQSKGAIILNSIASVKRLKPKFEEFLHPLIVAENTGLTGQSNKNESLNADLVLGTSTIDVGVDFKINFLIFESADAGSFIQRLGRLGRHDGYEREDKTILFPNFTAYALTSNFLVERLFTQSDHPLEIEGSYDRPFFHGQIQDKYRKINDFRGYYSRWSGIQSLSISRSLNHPTIRDQFAESRKVFKEQTETVFKTRFGRLWGCIEQWREEWEQLSGKKEKSLIEVEASSFRGSSSLLCGLYDLTEEYELDRFKTYDLTGILSNLDVEPMTKTEFMRQLEATAERINQPIAKGRFNYCLGFMKLHRYREERMNWRFSYGGDLQEVAQSWRVLMLKGIQVYQPSNRWVNQINEKLKKRGKVCYIVPYNVETVKKSLKLPIHFQIYPIDETGRDQFTAPYAIAFGQSALLLDTLSYRLKSKGGESWIC